MQRYSVFSLFGRALFDHAGWEPAWRKATLKPTYDVVVIGGGGHGLATAYYLLANHGVRRVAVIEKGWVGGGNVGRNTTVFRSNYLLEENIRFYEHALKLWEGLTERLNFNLMVSQRGCLMLACSLGEMNALRRRGNMMRLAGTDAEYLSGDEVRREVPNVVGEDEGLWPIYGGLMQRRAGTIRHDAVAWGLARGASALGADIVEDCEVTDFLWSGERIAGVKTTRGDVSADRVVLATAGSCSLLAKKAGVRLPIESHLLQAFVSEGLKPLVDTVIVWGGPGHFYISQSDKGGLVFGGDLDGYNSYAQRGNLPLVEDVISAGLGLMPNLSRVRLLRHWGGIMDMTMDGSPIIGAAPVDGLILNVGWCYGGFKAIPAGGWLAAHHAATGNPHELAPPFALDRFARGRLLDETGNGPVPNRQ
jgi:sarcosine oxidase subunit beta